MSDDLSFDARKASLGDVLVHLNIITPSQLQEALRECDPSQNNLGQVLVALGHTTEEKILKGVSMRLGIPYFNSFEGMLDPSLGQLLPEPLSRRTLSVPIFKSDDSLMLGMVNPLDLNTIDEVTFKTKLRIQPVMTTLSNLFATIETLYDKKQTAASSPEPRPARPTPAPPIQQPKDIQIDRIVKFKAEEKGVVELVNTLLQEAMARKASDIHLEAGEKATWVRFRVDDMLHDVRTFSKEQEAALVARIKILAKMDITETRLPQDGHIRFPYGEKKVDVRISTLPTIHGEKVVMRILDTNNTVRKLDELGLSKKNMDQFSKAIHRPNGLILVTGPTGSGKTTTLYAGLHQINDITQNIVTLEDPVEYRISRINQVETHSKIGLTFASGLRSILRQDPNVILVGEIRDLETATIAIQASITGHVVLSTLHTNDSVATINRLINMGVEPFLVAASLTGVMAQRLVRRLCEKCKKPHTITPAETKSFGHALKKTGPFFESEGCEACFESGYAGRFAVHEWLNVSRTIRQLILNRKSADEILAAAKKEGLKTLRQDALEKAYQGETSISEILRVTHDQEE